MATLKEHQAAMVDLLANGSGIPASASRLAHAMHDVLGAIVNGYCSNTEQLQMLLNDATTPGLNDKALSKREKALKTDSPAKWPTPAEQRVKELENTVRQLKANNAKLKQDVAELKQEVEHKNELLHESASRLAVEYKPLTKGDLMMFNYPGLKDSVSEQSGCRKPDTQVCEHLWNKTDLYNVFECLRCGVQEIKK